MPEVDAVCPCGVKIADGVFEAVEMMFGWIGVGLGEFDGGECNVWAAGSHGPDDFADATAVFDLCGCLLFCMEFGVARSDGGVELLEPCTIVGSAVGRSLVMGVLLSQVERYFLQKFCDIGVTGDLDVMSILYDVGTIEHVQKTLMFDWHGQPVVDHVHQDVGCLLIWGGNRKVFHLLFEDHTLGVNGS
jgi:hypothetical protein